MVVFEERCGKVIKYLGNGKIKFWVVVEIGRVKYYYKVNRFSGMYVYRFYIGRY